MPINPLTPDDGFTSVEKNPNLQSKKDESSGLGTAAKVVGIGALAALPFLKPFRDLNKVRSAIETIESQTGKILPRVETETEKVFPQLTYSPDKSKINYVVKEKPSTNIEPLLNDRNPQAKPMFGSAAYDAVKVHPKDEMLADEWVKFFKGKQNIKYPDGRSASIHPEELFDTNIAEFDKSGELVGGLLSAAKNINAPVSKELLLRQIKNNPINQMRLAEFKSQVNSTMVDELEGSVKSVNDLIKTKYPSLYDARQTAKGDNTIVDGLDKLNYSVNYIKNGFLNNEGISETNLQNTGEIFKNTYKALTKGNIDPQDKRILQEALQKYNAASEKITLGLKSPYKLQHNGSGEIGTYKLPGEADPREIVWYYPHKIPGNQSGSGHFSIPKGDLPDPNVTPAPLVHAMYGTRYTPAGEKVVSINEIQADVQQSVMGYVKEGKKRINPLNKEGEAGLLIAPKKGIENRINELLKKGLYATDSESIELNNLLSQQRSINQRMLQSNLPKDPYASRSSTDYLPMYDTKQYTDYAIKTIARKAAEEGQQWVSVVPVTSLSRNRGIIPGNEIVYGYANGKGINKKGEAIIPEVMRKLANQYKTEVKTIQVSKSDPERPWKIVSERKIDKPDSASIKTKHHMGAFKTKEEADTISVGIGGNKIEYIPKDDPNLYDLMYALRITPDMANKPFKLYKHTGGLIEDIFKIPV